ncbi:DUF1460 domain-containing protein [Burkholderia dolosa]|uniref:DUF1460 domain-containing protein n=1 Tax=Burkholderia dolosa TaxID=152500 RepID=A0A892IEL8_9BURK|nr:MULTISPECIES: N-acetylmuramoyl-L-alanine amidase-like domain-containing protein [Burkholderia]AKE06280.1 lipoprotein [Burkholderia cepacia]AJY10830.1 hypothetical protein AK34_3597 [Burkholderia dolosa AU0158]AYZ95031.1 DUF1460 domain-containing protein [Burkholderia dolosa]EAY70876.1 hypothetical protein BDAG_03685 [Burkholderia dolosa AU0158]ETP62906.1 hypothetical protein BDSB_21665 [Burkholderia dolosa PC543]
MTVPKIAPLVAALTLYGCYGDTPTTTANETIEQQHAALADMSDATSAMLDTLLAIRATYPGNDTGGLIDVLSRAFLDVPYRDGVLEGSAATPERLVIDFSGLDCFTYLDYVEAARSAATRADYATRLVRTRYVDGDVSFWNRRHFFTDWAARSPVLADDITATISARALSATKLLNRKADGSAFLSGLPVVSREVVHIPSEFVDDYVVSRLRTGDFIGIYAKADGLDVTHVGFFIDTPDGPMLRNASSKKANMKVVDSPFLEYVKHTPGIVVLRPREYGAASP